jgi:hypothetical protein
MSVPSLASLVQFALRRAAIYRLSFDSKLPALAAGSLKKAWAEAGSKALANRAELGYFWGC